MTYGPYDGPYGNGIPEPISITEAVYKVVNVNIGSTFEPVTITAQVFQQMSISADVLIGGGALAINEVEVI